MASDPTLRIVCISDTHNDNCTAALPPGDILIHAGDLTDDGTLPELRAAYAWLAALPHALKLVIAGNHETALDPSHAAFDPGALALFTSSAARAANLHYLARGTHRVPLPGASHRTLTVYANPATPEFLGKPYAFIYPPAPSPQSAAAWADAPTAACAAPIWITHGPPFGRRDWIPLPPLTGCRVQAERVRQGRPVVNVFGHYHVSHGVEAVRWGADEAGDECETLVKDGEPGAVVRLAGLERGEKTVFVNAAWMTMKKPRDGVRYQPVVVEVPVGLVAD